MFTAHIKSPFGDRTEEWEDTRVAKELAHFTESQQVYVLGYNNGQGEEALGIVSHTYWDLQQEVAAFSRDLDTPYPKLVEFTRQSLVEFGGIFKQYKDMEDPLLARSSLTTGDYTAMEGTLKEIRDKNAARYEEMMPIMAIINKREQADEAKLALRAMLQSLYDFSNQFHQSGLSMSILIKGLLIRSSGGEYTPLQYVNELGELQKAAEQRKEVEKTLTAARGEFLRYYPATTS